MLGVTASFPRLCCWTLSVLTATAAAAEASVGPGSNPLTAGDRISSYALPQRRHCQRLCWYVAACQRYSFRSDQGGSPPAGGVAGHHTCVLHATAGQGLDLSAGWSQELASGQSLPPNHGCSLRHCADKDLCLPVVSRDQRSVCVSLPGYNDCASSPCQNGGSCVDQVNNYTCTCAAGYTGWDCQTDMDDCASSPCLNGGSCADQVNSYTCTCAAGYVGTNCQTGTWLKKGCAADSDCLWSMTACYSGQCLCDGGYFFSHSQYACVQTCESFHATSYLMYSERDFYGHDTGGLWGKEMPECVAACSADPHCRLIVRAPNACYFKPVTAQQYPADWKPQSGITTYQKTCA